MSDLQIAVLVASALLVFWMVGAYNRLVALRSAIGTAWQLVDDVLKQRGDALLALVQGLRVPLAAEHGALDALLAAQAQVRAAADALGAQPVAAALATALVAGEAAMASAAARVLALLDQHDAARRDPALAAQVAVVRDSVSRLAFARQLFNDAALAYNDAAAQFPTRLLARSYGFGAAGRL